MIRALALLLALATPGAAAALTAEEMAGEWESVDGSNNTCAANPARLSVQRGPDHVIFDWPNPLRSMTAASVTGWITTSWKNAPMPLSCGWRGRRAAPTTGTW